MAMTFEEMVKAQQEANDKKALYNTFASAADELSSVPTVGDIMLKRQVKGNAGAGLRAIAESQQDPLALEKLRRDFQDAEAANKMKQEQAQLEKEKFGFDKENKTLEMARKERDQLGDLYSKGVIDPTSPIKFKRDANYQKPMSPMEQQLAEMNKELKQRELDKPDQPQVQAAGFAKRMESAQEQLSKPYNPDSWGAPGTLSGSLIPEAYQGSEQKERRQAERNFMSAVLRKESGAAISKSEEDLASQMYFPRKGDSPEVLKQKEVSRLQALMSMKQGGGREYAKMGNVVLPKEDNSKKMPGLLDNTAQAAPMDAPKPHEQDNQAVQWAKANPKDPRAAAILQANGVK